jgi:hypothetical protein
LKWERAVDEPDVRILASTNGRLWKTVALVMQMWHLPRENQSGSQLVKHQPLKREAGMKIVVISKRLNGEMMKGLADGLWNVTENMILAIGNQWSEPQCNGGGAAKKNQRSWSPCIVSGRIVIEKDMSNDARISRLMSVLILSLLRSQTETDGISDQRVTALTLQIKLCEIEECEKVDKETTQLE